MKVKVNILFCNLKVTKFSTLNKFFILNKGLLFNIVPFNFPFWLSFKTTVPNLALGNSVLLKPSESCPRIGLLVEKLV